MFYKKTHMVPWVGVARTGKRQCYNLSFRVGFARPGKLMSDVTPVCQLSGIPRARQAQEGVPLLSRLFTPQNPLRSEAGQRISLPRATPHCHPLGSTSQSLHGGNTFAIPNQKRDLFF